MKGKLECVWVDHVWPVMDREAVGGLRHPANADETDDKHISWSNC